MVNFEILCVCKYLKLLFFQYVSLYNCWQLLLFISDLRFFLEMIKSH